VFSPPDHVKAPDFIDKPLGDLGGWTYQVKVVAPLVAASAGLFSPVFLFATLLLLQTKRRELIFKTLSHRHCFLFVGRCSLQTVSLFLGNSFSPLLLPLADADIFPAEYPPAKGRYTTHIVFSLNPASPSPLLSIFSQDRSLYWSWHTFIPSNSSLFFYVLFIISRGLMTFSAIEMVGAALQPLSWSLDSPQNPPPRTSLRIYTLILCFGCERLFLFFFFFFVDSCPPSPATPLSAISLLFSIISRSSLLPC